MLGPFGDRFLSLAEAVETYREFRQIVINSVEPGVPGLEDPDVRWAPSWLPIHGPQHPVVIDCSVAEGDPTPVRVIDLADIEGSPKPRAFSMGEMVCSWIEALKAGAWQWDGANSKWGRDDRLIKDEWSRAPLI